MIRTRRLFLLLCASTPFIAAGSGQALAASARAIAGNAQRALHTLYATNSKAREFYQTQEL